MDVQAAKLSQLRKLATDKLPDTTRFLFFDEDDNVLSSSFQIAHPEEELSSLKSVFSSGREAAVRAGVRIQTQRFEVHRFDPPLVYGRTMMGDPVHSEAFALFRLEEGFTGKPTYGVITFMLPSLSARLVPLLQTFCEEQLQLPASAAG